MDKNRLNYLLDKYLSNKASQQELIELGHLLKQADASELTRDALLQLMKQEVPALPVDLAHWQQIPQHIVQIDKQLQKPAVTTQVKALQTPPAARGKVLPLFRWAAAAAVLLVAGLSLFYFLHRSDTPSITYTDIVKQDSIITTAFGEQREVILPDSSHVWLNAASSLIIPASFGNKDRTVILIGEAFFDVTHKDNLPFMIRSGELSTTVLGTAFNIKAYPGEERMIVSVRRGKVKVARNDQVLALLTKGKQVSVVSASDFQKSTTDTLAIAAWKQGNLVYKDELLKDVVADLQRTFKDSVSIQSPALKTVRMTISFDKTQGLTHALDMICRITDKKLTLHRGTYIIE